MPFRKHNSTTPARTYDKGMGDAVANRTVNRKIDRLNQRKEKIVVPRRDDIALDEEVAAYCKSNNIKIDGYHVDKGDGDEVEITLSVIADVEIETWADVAYRVSLGNSSLVPSQGDAYFKDFEHEFNALHHHMRQASVIMSGRHLQHGDANQATRNMEVFTNCLEGSTPILTMEYGPIAIEKIAGKEVTVIAGDGVPRLAKINAHGEQLVSEIVFRQNTTGPLPGVMPTVLATEKHRWKLLDGSITSNLKVGDVIASPEAITKHDPQAVIHGLIYGDGTAHKRRRDALRPGVSQGRTYAGIRVCKQDTVMSEIHTLLDAAGYTYTEPAHADGDRVYYIGKLAHAKELPYTNDPEYIAGFIYGWWLADGSKGVGHALEISTASTLAAEWLRNYSAYAGYTVTMNRTMERKIGDGSYANGKPLNVIRIRQNLSMKVVEIRPLGVEKVYCPEEPVTGLFVLGNGLLTGNCSTSACSFLGFYLLLNGSGVGRCYDDSMMLVDWTDMPTVVCAIDSSHKDVQSGEITSISLRDAKHMYADKTVHTIIVPDSREGWAQATEKIETMTFAGCFRNDVLLLDFSQVRPRGSPIGGMQDRPASGPGPLMDAIDKVAKVKTSGMKPWRASMFIDHYYAECVLVGGARRAARMATKNWRDETIFGFIEIKRGGFLWSSNNSVTVDNEFWELVNITDPKDVALKGRKALWKHANKVFDQLCYAAYHDKTGEPGIINVEKLTWNVEGTEQLLDGDYAESDKYKLLGESRVLTRALANAWNRQKYKVITNPCGEIVISALGGYCILGSVVPFHAVGFSDSVDAFRVTARALIRVNLMNSLYNKEVKRTNRIGVALVGLHEYAWDSFKFGWKQLVNERESKLFWETLSVFKRAVQEEAKDYAKKLGVAVPHTDTTMVPAGTISKLFGLTEGAHLPSMREFIRWVQFANGDPLIEKYQAMGYPVKVLKIYKGMTIVGFPTKPTICNLGMGDALVTAAEATPAEQYEFLRLLEKYWIIGVEVDGETPLRDTGNQVSYTLKYDPEVVGYEEFKQTLKDGQSTIRCCSVMPQSSSDESAYEYLPEQPVTKAVYDMTVEAIQTDNQTKEDVGIEHVDCANGACPISFGDKVAS